jgi:hypothetical protein
MGLRTNSSSAKHVPMRLTNEPQGASRLFLRGSRDVIPNFGQFSCLLHLLAAALELYVIGIAAFAIGGHLDFHAALGAAKFLALFGRLRPRRALCASLAHFVRHGAHGFSSKKS